MNIEPQALLIQQPAIDFDRLLEICQLGLGRNVAESADASGRPLGDAERFCSALAAIGDVSAKAGFAPEGQAHLQYSFLLAVGEAGGAVLGVLNATSGMPLVCRESIRPGVVLLLISGSLRQWRAAVIAGMRDVASRPTLAKVLAGFERIGLAGLWRGYTRTGTPDGLFKLTQTRNLP